MTWVQFVAFVADALERYGQDMNQLVQEQMKRGNIDSEAATEEVIANSVPAILQDENNLRDLLSSDRSVFQSIMD